MATDGYRERIKGSDQTFASNRMLTSDEYLTALKQYGKAMSAGNQAQALASLSALTAHNRAISAVLGRARTLANSAVVDWALDCADDPSEFRRIVAEARRALHA